MPITFRVCIELERWSDSGGLLTSEPLRPLLEGAFTRGELSDPEERALALTIEEDLEDALRAVRTWLATR